MMLIQTNKMVVRCSSLGALLDCPGRLKLDQLFGVSERDPEVTYEGHYCHWKSACVLAEFGAFGPTDRPPTLPEDYRPRPSASWVVRYYVETLLDFTPSHWAIALEEGFQHDFGDFILSGHIDATCVNYDDDRIISADLWDLKSGLIVVDPAETNRQVEGYAALFYLEYPEVESLRVHIVQPLNEPGVEQRHSYRSFSNKELRELVASLESSIREAVGPLFSTVTTGQHCRLCDHALNGKCPAYQQDMKLELTDQILSTIPEETPIETLAERVLLQRKYEKALDAAKTELKERLLGSGLFEHGGHSFKVVSQERRSIDDVGAFLGICEDMEMPDDLIQSCLSVSVSSVHEAIACHLGVPKKSVKGHDSRSEFAENFGPITKTVKANVLRIG